MGRSGRLEPTTRANFGQGLVEQWGFKYVEAAGTYDLSTTQFKAELDKRGLVAIGGHFPYDRWLLFHLKDLKKGVPTGSLEGKTDLTNDVTLGSGQVDWPALLNAAQEVGVTYYFIEDESPTVLDQVPESLKFLEQLEF